MRIDVPTSADGSSGGASGGGSEPPGDPAARGGLPRGEHLAPVIPISAARRRRAARGASPTGGARTLGPRASWAAGVPVTAAREHGPAPARGAAPRAARTVAASPARRPDPRARVRRGVRPEAAGEAAAVGATPGRRHRATGGRMPGGPVRRTAPRRPVRLAAGGRAMRPRGRGPRRGERPRTPPMRLTRRGRVVLVTTVLALLLGALWLGTRVAAIAVPACGGVAAVADPHAPRLAVPGR
ncbi:hypothetical protein GCM10010106_24240 [Thermopolyspora flexuosa]|uniref:Uncharacterized protein n=1 Tax=Thermopolyspora flexuosa TaxID=103836 RepID=A0A543IVE0_9ACTN|nr:hypothetical protein [Thermopolyspora flexuosa]TQM74539.1 hypothetical protein FHX40_1217 [Thermopolyspora flexuosa]GGM76973.1 hypothetical protein GCM10010106_24240 [Thermopolyspora flexuosa]